VSWPTLRLTRKRLSAASVTVTSQPSSAGIIVVAVDEVSAASIPRIKRYKSVSAAS
jgi:hypothetical protein